MASIQGRIKVKTTTTVVDGRKNLSVEVSAPEELFFTADLLASKGAVRKVERILNESARAAAVAYIRSAERCLKQVKSLNAKSA